MYTKDLIAKCDEWEKLATTPEMAEFVKAIRAKLEAAQWLAIALSHVLIDCTEKNQYTISEVTEKIASEYLEKWEKA